MNHTISKWLGLVFLASIYFAACKLGLSLAQLHVSATPVWPGTGIALAAMLLFSIRVWPAILIAAFLVNLTLPPEETATGLRYVQATGIAIGNTLEAVVVAWLVNRFANGRKAFERVSGIFYFLCVAGLVGASLSASIGTFTLWACGMLPTAKLGAVWITWWMGNFVSALVIAPLILILAARPLPQLRREQLLEGAALFATVFIVTELIFSGSLFPHAAGYPLSFLIIPTLVWAALRFESRGVITAVTLVSCIAIVRTYHGFGPFAVGDKNSSLLLLQIFMCVATVTALTLAAAISERKAADAKLRRERDQLQESEARMRQLAENIREVFYVSDPQRPRTIYVSPAYEEVWGRSCQSLYDNPRSFLENIHPEDRPRVLEAVEQQARHERTQVEYRVLRPDGSVRWIWDRSFPVRDASGRSERLVGIAEDMTERRQANEEIRRLNNDLERRVQERTAQLEAINRELEAFCYSISHDLRAPLRAIRGFAEVVMEQYGPQIDERGRDYLRRACEAGAHMDSLINDLLKLSRVSSAGLQSSEINLSSLVEEIVAEIKSSEPQRHVNVSISPNLRAHGDERLLRLVLDNLLRNAWKFTGKRPEAAIEFGYKNGNDAAFFVRDNGVGFDMAYSQKLFGLFQRLHAASEFPGSGVGLAIVQRIINRHGGRVWAHGQPGAGATFYFTLPVGTHNS